MDSKKPSEQDLFRSLQIGEEFLPPLVVDSCQREVPGGTRASKWMDARVALRLPGTDEVFAFVVEGSLQSTPLAVRQAIRTVKSYVEQGDEYPMILVPYLSAERLAELEKEEISGVDMCGNGIVIVPGRLLVRREGRPNRYPTSRPLLNPYAGRSSMVARMLLTQPQWGTLKDLRNAIEKAGADLSMAQASKAVGALVDDLHVFKLGSVITLREPERLLESLARSYRRPTAQAHQALRLPAGLDWPKALSSDPAMRWSVTGASSLGRYTPFVEGGPLRIGVSDLSPAMRLLGDSPERIPAFADLALVEVDGPGPFFQNATDEEGIRWAGRIQAWLESQAGDPRQKDGARELRNRIVKEARR